MESFKRAAMTLFYSSNTIISLVNLVINAIRIKLWIWNKNDQYPLINMVFSKDCACVCYAVYHNRKIGIDFREMVSEEKAVYSIDQM